MRSLPRGSIRPGLRRLAIAIGAVALLAAVAVPATMASTPATSPAADAVASNAFAARHPLLAGTVRADLTVVRRDGTTILVHYERGRITALGATSITVTGRDGKGATFAITSTTRVRSDGHPIPLASLKVGDRVAVFGTRSGGDDTAFLIRRLRLGPAV
jgi:hypothetical protein